MRKRSVWVVEFNFFDDAINWLPNVALTFDAKEKAEERMKLHAANYPTTKYRVVRYDAAERRPHGKR